MKILPPFKYLNKIFTPPPSPLTAISSDSRPPKFEMLDINNCSWHLSAVANSVTSQQKIRQIRIHYEFTAHEYFT